MLSSLLSMPDDIVSIIMFCDSASLEYQFMNKLVEKYDIAQEYHHLAKDAKSLSDLKSSVNVAPLKGKKWLIEIDADNIDLKVIEKQAYDVYDTCILLYKTQKYGVYKKLCSSKFAKKLGYLCPQLYGGKLYRRDIEMLAKCYGIQVSEKHRKFLESKYSRLPDSICSLFSLIRSGYCLEDNSDIIEVIGLGDISVAGLVLTMLTVHPKSAKGRRVSTKRVLNYLEDLASDLSWRSIQNFILDTLGGMIDVKMAMITGHLNSAKKEVPPHFDDKRAARYNRMLRYRYKLASEISLEKLFTVRAMYQRGGDPQVAVIKWVYSIYDSVGCWGTPDTVRKQRIEYRVPVGASFNLDDYNAFGDLSMSASLKASGISKSANTDTPKSEDADDYVEINNLDDDDIDDVEAELVEAFNYLNVEDDDDSSDTETENSQPAGIAATARIFAAFMGG